MSRGGKARTKEALKASDHDHNWSETLIPFGILDLNQEQSQFIKRIVQFSLETQLRIRLIYYPPYHSKYNSIERCWAVLEKYGHGAILETVSVAINWTSNMKWKGKHPTVHLI